VAKPKMTIRKVNGRDAVFIGGAFQNYVEPKKNLNMRGRKAADSAEKSYLQQGMEIVKGFFD